jgi:outer membrane protein OmpA-like peptidoglycan-associated protein
MSSKADSLPKHVVRLGAVILVAAGASACSSVPDWVDPTTWVGGSDNQQSSSADTASQSADNGQTPDLSTVPDKPNTPSSADDQKQVADSLAADRARAQYSADTLKGGTEPAAAPPSATAPQAAEDVSADDNGTGSAVPSEAPKPAAPPAPMPKSAPGTLPSTNQTADAAPPAPAPATPAPQIPAAVPATVATTGMPAVPAIPAVSSRPVFAGDASLGFHASSAPPLDGSVAQFVPQPILARYQMTAAISPAAPGSLNASDEAGMPGTSPHRHHHAKPKASTLGMGGPEYMTGAVVANFDALQMRTASAAPAAAGNTPAAVVFFPDDTTVLDPQARAQVRDAARAFLASGGKGFVRVVGHSSSRTANMPLDRHLIWNFEHSQARANAVARALISEGVPADKVLVEAVGDTEPVYVESMPQGDEGNRRAEIFFQG